MTLPSRACECRERRARDRESAPHRARRPRGGADRSNTRSNRNAIYLCEQAAEELIRAVLTSEKIHAGVKHQLDAVIDLIPDANPIKPRLRELQHLSTYATSYRYTTPTGRIPTDPPAHQVAATADNIEAALLEVARRFGVALDAVDQPAANSSPIR
jgi:HEPN domain-containing protein